jgi:HAD superfamily hydrolase (TIGR01490 family)
MPSVAAFDFDGTLTYGDTILPFLVSVVGSVRFARSLPRALLPISARGLGRISATAAKECLFRIYLRGRALDEVRAAALDFATQSVPTMLRPEALARLRWHQRRGDRCFIVSASPDLYVAPWANTEGAETIASRLETDADGFLTGKHAGAACDGPEKCRRLREALGSAAAEIYAYGDSEGDSPLLAMAQHAYLRVFPRQEVDRS